MMNSHPALAPIESTGLHVGGYIRLYDAHFNSSELYQISRVAKIVSQNRKRRSIEVELIPTLSGAPLMIEMRQTQSGHQYFLWNKTNQSFNDLYYVREVSFPFDKLTVDHCTKGYTSPTEYDSYIIGDVSFALYYDSHDNEIALLETTQRGLLELYMGGKIEPSRVYVIPEDQIAEITAAQTAIDAGETEQSFSLSSFLELAQENPQVRNLSLLVTAAIILVIITLISIFLS